jgi:hypothetical protein
MTVRGKHRTSGADNLSARSMTTQQLLESSYQKVLNKYHSFLNEDIDDAFMDAIKGAESGGRNIKNVAGSTAYGHYQFLQSTAENMAKDPRNRNTPIYGKSWEEYKQDPKLQREFMKVATQDYKNTLAANKIPVTGGTLYMAHHFGPGTAVKMYQAGPNAKMSDVIPVYKKNKRGETVPNPVYTQNPALKPNQSVQYTHDRLDNLMIQKDKSKTLATIDKTPLWSGTTTVAQTTTTPAVKPPAAPTPPVTPVKPAADVAAVTPTAPTTTPKPPAADVAAAAMPTKPMPGADKIASADTSFQGVRSLPPVPAGKNFKDVFDIDTYLKAKPDERLDMAKFIKSTPAGQEYKKSLGERYQQFKRDNTNQLS